MPRVWNISGQTGTPMTVVLDHQNVLPGQCVDLTPVQWSLISRLPFLSLQQPASIVAPPAVAVAVEVAAPEPLPASDILVVAPVAAESGKKLKHGRRGQGAGNDR